MTQSKKNRYMIRRLALCCLLALITLMSAGAHASQDRVVTARIDPEDSLEAYITIQNCTVYIEPTDNDMADLKYDTGALRLEQAVQQGTHRITIRSVSGKRMGYEAAATLYLPRDAYQYVFVDVQNGETMVMKSIGASFDIKGDQADISLQYDEELANAYYLRLVQSRCTFAMDEKATNYAIAAQVNGGNIAVPMGGMPAYKAASGKIGEYNYSAGNGASLITADVGEGSTLGFVFVRKAD